MKFPLLKYKWKLVLLSACALLLTSGCGNAPSGPAQTQASSGTESKQPRTNLPMPPANAETRDTAKSGGQYGWTQLDSRRSQLADYAGQVVVLDFWATYCPPCLEETPHLVSLQKRYGAQGLKVIGLNVGGPDDRPKVAAYVEQFKVQYTLGYPDQATVDLYLGTNDNIPQTLVFDRQGKLIKHFVGFDPQVSAELDRTIENAVTGGK
ncbi:MAG: TlpA family protein disulfide reductase [Acidobacteria bacterium]|nr:TlpA family protein disulfide reductase [Acidobacteriota bacterium]